MGPDAATVAECKALEVDLSKLDVVHCFREANGVVDMLAKNSLCNSSSGYWDGPIPGFISHLVVHDLTII